MKGWGTGSCNRRKETGGDLPVKKAMAVAVQKAKRQQVWEGGFGKQLQGLTTIRLCYFKGQTQPACNASEYRKAKACVTLPKADDIVTSRVSAYQ